MGRAGQVGAAALLGAALGWAAALGALPLDEAALLYQHGDLASALQRLDAVAAPPGSADAFQAQLLRGLVLLALGRPGEALVPLSAAVQARPDDVDAQVDLGLAYKASARWSEAEAAFEAARRAGPKRKEPLLGLGSLAAGRGKPQAAEALYRSALAIDPKDAAAWSALADALIDAGDLRGAVDARQRSLQLRPDEELQFRQAVALYTLGDWDRAAAALELAQLGDKPEAYLLHGDIAYRRGDLAGAQRQYKAALELRPGYPEALLDLAITYYDQGDYPQAIARFDEVPGNSAAGADAREGARHARGAAVDLALHQGSEAVLAGDFPGAVRAWSKALDQADDKAPIRQMIDSLRKQQGPRAELLAAQGEEAFARGALPDALQAWRNALGIDPGNRRAKDGLRSAASDLAKLKAAYKDLGARLLQQGDVGAVSGLAEDLDAIEPGAGKALRADVAAARLRRIRALEDQSKASLSAGKPQDALASLAEAQGLDPESPRLRAQVAAARAALLRWVSRQLLQAAELERAGKLKAAYETVQAAQAMAPDDLEARREAERLAKRLDLKLLSPKAVEDLYYRGVYLYGAGDTQGALKLWRQGLEAAPQHRPLQQAVRSAEAKLRSLARLEQR